MNSKELYVLICQTLSSDFHSDSQPSKDDYSRDLAVTIARNHANDGISNITLEFKGIRAKFLCSIIFDGAGPQDTSLFNFGMPRQKATMFQKATICLACLQFLTEQKFLDADFKFFREKIHSEASGGVGNFLYRYDQLTESVRMYVIRDNRMQVV